MIKHISLMTTLIASQFSLVTKVVAPMEPILREQAELLPT